jgi:hypothetical protein
MDITKNRIKKIAISGKANSGKNTLSKLLANLICENKRQYKIMAFADPIKEMVLQMFPGADRKCLFGSSKLRNEIIPNALDKDNKPLTYRQALIDLGTLGREYNKNIWVNALDKRITSLAYGVASNNEGYITRKLIIIADLRFIEEYDYLQDKNFFLIRIKRDSDVVIDSPTETNQDQITDDQFDYVVDNNKSLNDLKKEAKHIVSLMKSPMKKRK